MPVTCVKPFLLIVVILTIFLNLSLQAEKCRSNEDCSIEESCTAEHSNLGQRECKNVCDGPVICGRNAICQANGHRPNCICPDGFFGNPNDEKVGCQKKLCSTNADCPGDSVCQDFRCIAPLEGKKLFLNFRCYTMGIPVWYLNV